jgi:hypothetical protein
MIGKKRLALVWGFGRHDFESVEEIHESIDCEHDKELLPDSLASYASMRNWGGDGL